MLIDGSQKMPVKDFLAIAKEGKRAKEEKETIKKSQDCFSSGSLWDSVKKWSEKDLTVFALCVLVKYCEVSGMDELTLIKNLEKETDTPMWPFYKQMLKSVIEAASKESKKGE